MNIRRRIPSIAAAFSIAASGLVAVPALAGPPAVPQVSPKARVEQQVGITSFAVEYASPGVRGRTIFGELVPWGEVWRTGANEATRLVADRDFTIAGKQVTAGTYALMTIPGKDKWTIILNSNPQTWGTYGYDEKLDVVRVEVEAEELDEKRERMTFLFSDTTDAATNLDLEWDRVRVRIPLAVDTRAHVLVGIESAVDEAWRPHYVSAKWLLENDVDLERALRLAETSIAVQPNWHNHWVKAQILAKTGQKALAVESAKAAQKLGKGDRIYAFYEKTIEAAIDDWE